MQGAFVVMMLLLAFPCFATDTLDCVGEHYSVMLHIGHDEHDKELVADLLLYHDATNGNGPLAVYSAADLLVSDLHWLGDEAGYWIALEAKPTAQRMFELDARGEYGRIRVNESEYALRCDW